MKLELFERKKQALMSAEYWINAPQEIIPAWDAFQKYQQWQIMRFVTWWGTDEMPLMAGFTRFLWDLALSPKCDDGREWFNIIALEQLEHTVRRDFEKIHRYDAVLVYGASS